MICLFIEPCLLSLSCLIVILNLLVSVKGKINLYLHVITVVLLVIFVQIVFNLGLTNLGTKPLSLEKMNQVL
jgi:predicted RND superfamily exporter protein